MIVIVCVLELWGYGRYGEIQVNERNFICISVTNTFAKLAEYLR